MDSPLTCFVIGPIGDGLAPIGSPGRNGYEEALDVYANVIVPACEANHLEPIRSDQIALAGEITEQIFRHLKDDDLVIADISGGNPNVMYELGLRHSTAKPTIQLGEYGQLPFDIAGVRTIQFSRSERGLIDARKALQDAIAVALVDGAGPLTAGRLWKTDELSAFVSTPEDSDTEMPDDGAGFIEMIEEINEGLSALAETAQAIAETIERIGVVTEESTTEIDTTDAARDAKSRLTLVARYAHRLADPAERLEMETDQFVQQIVALDASMLGLGRFLTENPDFWDEEQVGEFYEMVRTLAAAGREGMEGVNTMATTAQGLGSISRRLRVPGRRISESVRRMAKSVSLMDNWEAAFGRILRERPVDQAS